MRRAVGAYLDRTRLGQPVRRLRRVVYRRLDALVSAEPIRIRVRPRDIELVTTERYDKYLGLRVKGGDWDLAVRPFDELDVHRAIDARVHRGVAWQETEFYGRVVAQMAAGTSKWGCTTPAEFDQRCVELDALIGDIVENGFRDTSEVSGAPVEDRDGITLYVGRSGELIFQDGRHRLAIAKVLDLPSVPAVVVRRHRLWEDMKAELREQVTTPPGVLPLVLRHPDLVDVPQLEGDGEFDDLAVLLDGLGHRILDIGSHGAQLAHQLSSLGYHCTAVVDEGGPVATRLARVSTARFEVVRGLDQIATASFDVAVCTLLNDEAGFEPLDRIVAQTGLPRTRCLVLRLATAESRAAGEAGRSRLERAAGRLQRESWHLRDQVVLSGGATVLTLRHD